MTHQDKIGAIDAVVEGGTDDAGVDDNLVLELVDPALVDDGDELNNVGAVEGPKDHVEEHLACLYDGEDRGQSRKTYLWGQIQV